MKRMVHSLTVLTWHEFEELLGAGATLEGEGADAVGVGAVVGLEPGASRSCVVSADPVSAVVLASGCKEAGSAVQGKMHFSSGMVAT